MCTDLAKSLDIADRTDVSYCLKLGWSDTRPRIRNCNSETASALLPVATAVTWKLRRLPPQRWRGKERQATDRNKNDADVHSNSTEFLTVGAAVLSSQFLSEAQLGSCPWGP